MFTSESGEFVGQGQRWSHGLSDGNWVIFAEPTDSAKKTKITVTVRGNPWWWTLVLTAPPGQTLAPGTYENAASSPFPTGLEPGLYFYGSGRTCGFTTGRFVIHELVVGAARTVNRLYASFKQHCGGPNAPALAGEVAVLTNPWR